MATIKDVANRAGVSTATVSRVLNSSGPVSVAAAERIRDAAAKLHYVPHGGARALITAKTSTLGVLLPDLYGEFFSEVIRGIDQTAHQHGYHLLLSGSHTGKPEIESAMRAMRGRTDGIIAMSPHLGGAAVLEHLRPPTPVVLLSCPPADGAYHVISIDNRGGVRAMMAHLLSLGHKRIAMIRGAPGNYDADERLLGYHEALAEAGIGFDESIVAPGDFTEAAGHRAAMDLVRLTPRPTAIFGANDATAVGAMSALRDAGYRVPNDVTVVGFDDIPLARYMHPPLASVHVPILELGARAARRLIAALTGESSPAVRHEQLATRFIARGSCSSPPSP